MALERPLESLSDDELLRGLADLLRQSRRVERDLVAHIAEVETRRLYARAASPSMFVYCTSVLHLSEAEAYLRITVPARLGSTPDVIRKLPIPPALALPPDPVEGPGVELRPGGVPASAASLAVAAPPARVEPVSPARFKVQFTAGPELCDKLERLRALLRPEVPDGDLAAIVEKAVTEKLERLEARRFGQSRSPRKALARTHSAPSSRHIPAAVRRVVYRRDQGRCGLLAVPSGGDPRGDTRT